MQPVARYTLPGVRREKGAEKARVEDVLPSHDAVPARGGIVHGMARRAGERESAHHTGERRAWNRPRMVGRLGAIPVVLGFLTSRGACDHVVGASNSDWLPPIFDERLQANTVAALELAEIGRNQTKRGDPLFP